ncbi:MAG: CaiB/BaiF CoA-transferase family protein [Pseudomonadota bacterium]
MDQTNTPLAGVRVLELARILAGPWAGQVLADLGADVVKIESPEGDDTRGWGPPFVNPSTGPAEAAYFHSANRGKRSVSLDFSKDADLSTLHTLIEDADVLIENFKVGGLAKYGLDYPTLHKHYPELIYCSITGFGQTGPDAHLPGYDFIIQGLSGIMDLTGDPEGEPQKIGVAFADIFTGMYAVIGIQAALHQRKQTGQGQHLDLSLLDCMMGVLANQSMNYLVSGDAPTRLGNAHPNISPYEVLPTADGWFILAVGNDAQFSRCCEVLGCSEITAQAQYRDNQSRLKNRQSLTRILTNHTSNWKTRALLDALQEALVPCGPIHNLKQAFNAPQVLSREIVKHLQRSDGLTIPTVPTPIKFSGSELALDQPAPALGAHQPEWKSR